MNFASALDVDSDNLDAVYTETVKRARELMRLLENSVQASFEDGALLLNMIQSANSPSPLWKALATAVPALRSNISDICSHIADLTQISQSQAEACAKAGVQALVGYRNASRQGTKAEPEPIGHPMFEDRIANSALADEDIVQFGDVLGGSTWSDREITRQVNAEVYGTIGRTQSNSSLSRIAAPAATPHINARNRGYSNATTLSDDTRAPDPSLETLVPTNGIERDPVLDDEDFLEGELSFLICTTS